MILELAFAAKCPYILTHNVKDFPARKNSGIKAITYRRFSAAFGKNEMSSVTIDLPDSLKERIEELAASEGITPSQFISSAAGENWQLICPWATSVKRLPKANRRGL